MGLGEAVGLALGDAVGDALTDGLTDGLAEGLGDADSPAVGLGEGSASGVSLALSVADSDDDDSDDDGCEAGDSTEGDGAVSSSRDPVRASNVASDAGVVVGSAGVSGSSGSVDSFSSGDADSSCDSSDVGDGEAEAVEELDAVGDGDGGVDVDGEGDTDADGDGDCDSDVDGDIDGDAVGDGEVVASLGMHRAGISIGMFHSETSDSSVVRSSSDCVCAASWDGCSSSAPALGIPVRRRATAANAVTMIRASGRTRAGSKDGSAVVTVVTSPLDQASWSARSTWSPGGSAP